MTVDLTIPPNHESADAWIYANWQALHCYHQKLEDAAWVGYKASLTWGGASFNPNIWTDLSAMIASGDQFVGCGGLAPDLQGYFGDLTKECQCAEYFGDLFVRYRNPAGLFVDSLQSAPNDAKEIVSYGTDDQGTYCQWNDVDGLLHIQRFNEPMLTGSTGYWFIVPAGGGGCCEGENSFPTRPPKPLDIVEGTFYPEARCGIQIEILDAAVDHWDIVWKKWRVFGSFSDCAGPTWSTRHWWESVDGPYIFDPSSDVFLEHPHRLKGCYGNHSIAPPSNEKPKLEGVWVTTRWISCQKMEHSGRRLRKLFRYRSKGGRFLPQLTAWWTNFQWEAGDTCVIHKGAWWGTPQVWAATEAEGKRVIRFAASEAGIDPDQVGEWQVTSASAPRIGMSGTMRVHLKDGFPWVASRPGSDFPNLLALPVDP